MCDNLNEDFTTCGAVEPWLKRGLRKGGQVDGGSILQIQNVLNISVAKQDGPQGYDPERQIVKLVLTDGDSTVYGLVSEPIQNLGINTPPGTKIKIVNDAPVHGQMIFLTRLNAQILGGHVPKLVEKWNFQRAMDVKKEWGAVGKVEGSEGPPVWRPFGQKSEPMDVALLRKMKAMDIVNEKKDAAGNDASHTQFELQRLEAISGLMEKNVKQNWQKPNKHLVDKEVQEIIDEGFTYEEAYCAMEKYKNQQRALKFLKAGRGEYPRRSDPSEDRRDKKRRAAKVYEEDDEAPIPREYQRPTDNVLLFGFISSNMKLKGAETDSNPSESSETQEYQGGRGRGRGGRGGFTRGGFSRGDGHRGRGGRGDGSDYKEKKFSLYDTHVDMKEIANRSLELGLDMDLPPDRHYRGGNRDYKPREGGRRDSRRSYNSASGRSYNGRGYQSDTQNSHTQCSQDVRSFVQPPRPQQYDHSNSGEPSANYNSFYPSNSLSQTNNRYPSPRSLVGGYSDQGNRQWGPSNNDYGIPASDNWNSQLWGGGAGRGRGGGGGRGGAGGGGRGGGSGRGLGGQNWGTRY